MPSLVSADCVTNLHSDVIWDLAWSPDGNTLASCSGDKTIRLYTLCDLKLKPIAVLEDGQTRTIRSVEFSKCGSFIASTSFDGTTIIWEKEEDSYNVIATLEGHESEVKSVTWSSEYLATCSRDKSVWIWENDPDADFECLSVLHGHTQDVKFVAFHPTIEPPMLFSASYDNTIRVYIEYDDDWRCEQVLHGHDSTVWALAFSSDKMVSCSDDQTMIIWKYNPDATDYCEETKGTMKWTIDSTIHVSSNEEDGVSVPLYSVDWKQDDDTIAVSCGDNSIRVYSKNDDTDTDKSFIESVKVSNAHEGDVNCVRWHPTIRGLLVSCGDDASVKLWKYNL